MRIKRDDLHDIKKAGDAQAGSFAAMAILIIGISGFFVACLLVADKIIG